MCRQEKGTYAVANACSAVLAGLEGVDEGDDDARARVADGMPERDGTAKERDEKHESYE